MVTLFRSAVLGLAFFAMSSTQVLSDQLFCRAYADEAVLTVKNAQHLGCGYTGGRWTSDLMQHLRACWDWERDTNNGGTNAMNEYVARSSDLAKCEAKEFGVKAPFSSSAPFTSNRPTLDNFCRAYAYIARMQSAGAQRECGLTGARWDASFEANVKTCNDWGSNAGHMIGTETFARTNDRIQCSIRLAKEAEAAAGNNGGGGGNAPQPLTIQADVTGYNQPQGNERCYFAMGDTVEFVMQNDTDPIWVMVEGKSGDCQGKRAWIYNDGKLP